MSLTVLRRVRLRAAEGASARFRLKTALASAWIEAAILGIFLRRSCPTLHLTFLIFLVEVSHFCLESTRGFSAIFE